MFTHTMIGVTSGLESYSGYLSILFYRSDTKTFSCLTFIVPLQLLVLIYIIIQEQWKDYIYMFWSTCFLFKLIC